MDGVIVIYKEKGYTSHDVVSILRKTINIKKIGHTGTLDPNATGVLPILIGNATKISKYLIEHDKTYIATLKLGEKTETGDGEGKIIEQKESFNILEKDIVQVLKSFIGKQLQIPPMYSAIKCNGKKLYEYARKGEKIAVKSREIEIYNIQFLKKDKDNIIFKVSCSKGTYIRVLCEQIAEKLGTVGYMKELERVKVNEFDISQAITLDEVKENVDIIKKKIIPIEYIFRNKKSILIDEKHLRLFLNGVKLSYDFPDDVYRIFCEKNFIGLGIITNKLLKRDIIEERKI